MKWLPVDIIVFFLAVVIGLMLVGSVVKPLITGQQLTETAAKQIGGIIAAVVAIISIYVGSKLRDKDK